METTAMLLRETRGLLAVLWVGLACGTMDIRAGLVVYGYFGLEPMRLLQGIASGLLRPKAFEGGLATRRWHRVRFVKLQFDVDTAVLPQVNRGRSLAFTGIGANRIVTLRQTNG
jgi:hypothetical protein